MQVLHSRYHMSNHNFDCFLIESPHFTKFIEELSLFCELKDQVEVVIIFDAVVHLDDVFVLESGGNFYFFVNLGKHIILHQFLFGHLLQRECLLCFDECCLINCAKSSVTLYYGRLTI